jgi:hypothetical protein
MRLTLRTMLAYLDEVLEPADAEALRLKIEESDFASGLVDRIQGVLKKLRIDAPRLDGKGMGNDANTVAEYLDSALTQDRVAEFERVCLESDKHLSEVASCHQILTLVLGKAADVPAELRQRIYSLGDPTQAVPQGPPAPPVTAAHPVEAKTVAAPNGKPHAAAAKLEVPAYLRSGNEASFWPFALVAGLALAVTLGILWKSGMLDKMNRGNQNIAAAPESGDETTTPPADATAGAPAAPETAAATDTTVPAAAVAAATTEADVTPATPALPAVPEAPSATPDRVPVAVADASTRPTPPPTTTPEPADNVPAAAPMPATPVSPESPRAKSPIVAAPVAPKLVEVGRYISDSQLIATLDRDDNLWYAKQPQEILTAGEQLVVLPPYRPQLALPSAVQLTFAGEGALKMEEPGENKVPRVSIEHGRFLAATAGRPGAQVELNLAGITGIATLVDGDSVLAVKVTRWVPPGADPEAGPGEPIVEIYNTNGRVTWQRADQPAVDIPARHVHVHQGNEAPQMYGPFMSPEWIDYKGVKAIDRESAAALEKMVSTERPLNLTLQEVMKDRKVRPLAARCLAALGEYEAILRELGDANQYSFWQSEFETLRQAMSSSPEAAAKIRETIHLMRPADARDIYRLLWGFTDEQLNAGAAAQLVKFLEHDQLDIRVLAHSNLIAVTGPLGYYRAEKGAAQNRPAIQNWKDRQSKGGVVYKTAPSPLDIYKPISAAPAVK